MKEYRIRISVPGEPTKEFYPKGGSPRIALNKAMGQIGHRTLLPGFHWVDYQLPISKKGERITIEVARIK